MKYGGGAQARLARSEIAEYQHKTKTFYHGSAFQSVVAALIVTNFVLNLLQSEIVPEPGEKGRGGGGGGGCPWMLNESCVICNKTLVCVPACMHACLPACLGFIRNGLRACLPARLPAPACLQGPTPRRRLKTLIWFSPFSSRSSLYRPPPPLSVPLPTHGWSCLEAFRRV